MPTTCLKPQRRNDERRKCRTQIRAAHVLGNSCTTRVAASFGCPKVFAARTPQGFSGPANCLITQVVRPAPSRRGKCLLFSYSIHHQAPPSQTERTKDVEDYCIPSRGSSTCLLTVRCCETSRPSRVYPPPCCRAPGPGLGSLVATCSARRQPSCALAAGGGALVLLLEADPCALTAVGDGPAPDSTPLTADTYLQQARVDGDGTVLIAVRDS